MRKAHSVHSSSGAEPSLTGSTTTRREWKKRETKKIRFTQCQAGCVICSPQKYAGIMGNRHGRPSFVHVWNRAGRRTQTGTGRPPLAGLTLRRAPSTKHLPRPTQQCPFWSLARTALHHIPILTPPPPSQAGVGVEFLHYGSSPPFSPRAHPRLTDTLCWSTTWLPPPSALLAFWLLCVTEAGSRSGLSPKPVLLSVLDQRHMTLTP